MDDNIQTPLEPSLISYYPQTFNDFQIVWLKDFILTFKYISSLLALNGYGEK